MGVTKKEYRKKFLDGKRMPTIEEHLQVLDDLPDLPDWAELYSPIVIGIGEYRVDIPYNPTLFKEFRGLLGSKWKRIRSWKNTQSGDHVYEYLHSSLNVELHIVLIHSKTGSTCERVLVGQKTTDIYEVHCDEVIDGED